MFEHVSIKVCLLVINYVNI